MLASKVTMNSPFYPIIIDSLCLSPPISILNDKMLKSIALFQVLHLYDVSLIFSIQQLRWTKEFLVQSV